MDQHRHIWNQFCSLHFIETNKVPLFATSPDLVVMTKQIGRSDPRSIQGIETNTRNFARWGDNYAYHIGDLSAVAIPGHDSKKANPKYKDWAASLFHKHPTKAPVLKRQVFFWAKA